MLSNIRCLWQVSRGNLVVGQVRLLAEGATGLPKGQGGEGSIGASADGDQTKSVRTTSNLELIDLVLTDQVPPFISSQFSSS